MMFFQQFEIVSFAILNIYLYVAAPTRFVGVRVVNIPTAHKVRYLKIK